MTIQAYLIKFWQGFKAFWLNVWLVALALVPFLLGLLAGLVVWLAVYWYAALVEGYERGRLK